jgi:hypothetical protein
LYQQTAFKISLLLYDSVLYGGKQYEEYLSPEAVRGRQFDVKIEVMPDERERQFLEAMIQTSLSAGVLDFEDAFRIRSIKNTKLAEMYMAKAKKNKEKAEMEKAQRNSEMNAQVQQQSIQAKAQADAQLQELESQGKLSIVTTEMKMKQELSEQEFVQLALLKSYELGRPLSPEMKEVVDAFFAKKQQKEIEMQMAQQQQMEQEQAQMDEAE